MSFRAPGGWLVGVVAGVLLGCAGAPERTTDPRLRVITEPPTARVFVDDNYIATGRVLGAQPVRLAPGMHHVTLTADGHFPHDVELRVVPGVTTLRVALRPIPP